VPVIAGAGSNCTRESVETIEHIIKVAGPISFLCVTGYYNNPPQEGLILHFETLVKETGAKIVMYNVPSRTNSYLEPETVIHLAANPNIIGLKQAVDFKSPGKWREDTLQIMAGVKDLDFSVVSGEDDALFSILEMGGTGMISATGNIPEAAKLFLTLMAAFSAGNKKEAEKLQEEADRFVKACFIRKNPIPLAALFNSPVFQPLVTVKETSGGKEAHLKLMALVDEAAPSLKKYHKGASKN
jgi:4-hydroxy-tetrahydrodipicolinate synthase